MPAVPASLEITVQVFSSPTTFWPKLVKTLDRAVLMRPSSALPAASSAAPLRTKLSRLRVATRVCSAVRPAAAAPSATALTRLNRASLKVISSLAADSSGDTSVSTVL